MSSAAELLNSHRKVEDIIERTNQDRVKLLVFDNRANIFHKGKWTFVGLQKADGSELSEHEQSIVADTLETPQILREMLKAKHTRMLGFQKHYTFVLYPPDTQQDEYTFDIIHAALRPSRRKPLELPEIFSISTPLEQVTYDEDIYARSDVAAAQVAYASMDSDALDSREARPANYQGVDSRVTEVLPDTIDLDNLSDYQTDYPNPTDITTSVTIPLRTGAISHGDDTFAQLAESHGYSDYDKNEPMLRAAAHHLPQEDTESTIPYVVALTKQGDECVVPVDMVMTRPLIPEEILVDESEISPQALRKTGSLRPERTSAQDHLTRQSNNPTFERQSTFASKDVAYQPTSLQEIVANLQGVSDNVSQFSEITPLKFSHATIKYLQSIAELGSQKNIQPILQIKNSQIPFTGFAREYIKARFYAYQLRDIGLHILQMNDLTSQKLRTELKHAAFSLNQPFTSAEDIFEAMLEELETKHQYIYLLQEHQQNELFQKLPSHTQEHERTQRQRKAA